MNSPLNRKQPTWRETLEGLNPVGKSRPVLFYKGDPTRARKGLLVIARVFQIVYFTLIPLSILALTVILPSQGYIPKFAEGIDTGSAIAIFYIYSIIALILGYKWKQVYSWLDKHTNLINKLTFNDNHWETLNSHLSRVSMFMVIICFAFGLGLGGVNWFFISPLLISAGLALFFTYPTRRKWAMWIAEKEQPE